MNNATDLKESLTAINNLTNNQSWFGEHTHRWPLEATPLGYAMACVEVVSQSSEQAGAIYQQIIEAWGRADTETLFQELISEASEEELEEIKQVIARPERVSEPDYGKPFKEYEELMNNTDFLSELFKNEADFNSTLLDTTWDFEKAKRLFYLVFKFILLGFNRESDINKGKYKVVPTEKAPWLTLAIMYRSAFEYKKITQERLRKIYKIRKINNKVVDFEKVLTEERMNRMGRRIVAAGTKANLKSRNDQHFVKAARNWYQCRIVHTSIEKFCGTQSGKNIFLDPKNVHKQIRPCDKAVGYRGRSTSH